MEGIWGALGENPSATVVLAVFVVMLALGLFVPRWVMNAMLQDKDEEIRHWRHATEQREKQIDYIEESRRQEAAQTERATESSEVMLHILEEIRDEAKRRGAP